jgi:hypothetical protein
MNAEPWTISASMVISLLSAGFAGVCLFVLNYYREKLEKLDAEAVRKRELKELEERLSTDQREMHDQNIRASNDLKGDVNRLVNRIDAMFNRGGGR